MISYEDFEKVDIRVGTITGVEDFPEARKPSYKLIIDFGDLGTKKSSVQIVSNYSRSELVGKQVLCCVNLGSKKIANFISEVLTLGVNDDSGNCVLIMPERKVQNGGKLY